MLQHKIIRSSSSDINYFFDAIERHWYRWMASCSWYDVHNIYKSLYRKCFLSSSYCEEDKTLEMVAFVVMEKDV